MSSGESEEVEFDEFDQGASKSDIVMEWNDLGAVLEENGSNGSSSSSSSSLVEERRSDELGVRDLGKSLSSGSSGAAIARLEVALGLPWDHRSGLGELSLRADNEAGFEEAADNGLGIGLNSLAFALRSLGELRGELGKLAANCACAYVA